MGLAYSTQRESPPLANEAIHTKLYYFGLRPRNDKNTFFSDT